ncbi:MAG: carbamoyl-phosphate synthase large subunit [Francisellaceae bacterium]|nr:carbamoyl-phosphate synthase large subunit [Francisellaceae bacterium]
MPRREDISSILIIGSGPIVIGQGCEFDYSGVQACRALKSLGYRIILINSNPATIMTDPDVADATYMEPLHWENIAEIIKKERPDVLLPTMGGQTALNCALDLYEHGVLDIYNVELIGASKNAIDKAEDREKFYKVVKSLNLEVPKAAIAHSLEEALQVQPQMGFPTIIRPSFTLGGTGGGIAYNREDFVEICQKGLSLSPTKELLIEESLIGWKEFEMEVIRDKNDNGIIICSIENIDPMGVHTGDSITVAPAQTLTDKELQKMRSAAINILRAVGVETGGANVQFAVCPVTGKMLVIEMNPRVSRSSALASKATGFPIAKIAAKLAVGYTLDESENDITGGLTPASFEPTIDYVVVKIPRFDFDKFPKVDQSLSTQMKSIGEVMVIGSNFSAALQKGLCALELGVSGLDLEKFIPLEDINESHLIVSLKLPGPIRILYIAHAFRLGWNLKTISKLTKFDCWFLQKIKGLVAAEANISKLTFNDLNKQNLMEIKQQGFSDSRIAQLMNISAEEIRTRRIVAGVIPAHVYIDSCAGEFPAKTAYCYSSYENEDEFDLGTDIKQKVIVIGSGPNRIGQGIEFDYCCVQAILAIREAGMYAIMINCNPETVSTDYDISNKLYFEPIVLENVLDIIAKENPYGVIVQLGGQTPLKLANDLVKHGVNILGTSTESIDLAENRSKFSKILSSFNLRCPENACVTNVTEGLKCSAKIGFPLMVRPSYVLGGQAMEVVNSQEELAAYLGKALLVNPGQPVLLDKFLDNATEIDVDAVVDVTGDICIPSMLQHIEQAGVHSGDSACCLPPYNLDIKIQQEIKDNVTKIAGALKIVGLMNVQFAVQGSTIYVLEVNPRASRTSPFVAKATGISMAKIATHCMLGTTLKELKVPVHQRINYYNVKIPVFPFEKLPGADPILGPEMKSTGEVLGMGTSFAKAYAKALKSVKANYKLQGNVFVSVKDSDKKKVVYIVGKLNDLGFNIVATRGTAKILREKNLPCKIINKVVEGRPHIVDMIKNNEIVFIINTTSGRQSIEDSYTIRSMAVSHQVNHTTTISGAHAIVEALQHWLDNSDVCPIQTLHKDLGVI